MTRNFVGGLVSRAEIHAKNVHVFDRNPSKNLALQNEFDISIGASASSIVENCDVVIISVKPQVLSDAVSPLKTVFSQHQPLTISLAAGTTLQTLEALIGSDTAIVRAMPNMAALIGLGATGLLANARVNEVQRNQAQFIADSVGISTWVKDDAGIDSITALSGSGPAYFMLFIDYLAQSAQRNGIDEKDSLRFAIQTALGAANSIQQSDGSIDELIDSICSKGGTTEQAIMQLKNDKLNDVVSRAFNAAKRRSQELANAPF